MSGPCSDLRVLDLSRERAGAMATMVLADFGADVVRVEGNDCLVVDDPMRTFLHRGKRSIGADVSSSAGRDEVHRLARGFDVVVESLGAGRAEQFGIGYAQLGALNPSLVYCSITGYGATGPLADAPFDDGLVMAKAGVFRDQLGWLHDGHPRPVFRAARDASYQAAMLAVQGVVSALRARELTGRGQLVETSLLQGLTHRLNPMVRWVLPEGETPPFGNGYTSEPPAPARPNAAGGAEITGMLAECKDGRFIVHMLFERNFFPSWVSALGMDWIWNDARFQGAPHAIADPDDRVELSRLFATRMKEKTAAEWMELYVAQGNVCADVVQTTHEALDHPQVEAAGLAFDDVAPNIGAIRAVGPLAKLPQSPPSVDRPAPEPYAHTDEVAREEVAAPAARPATGVQLTGPLDGITVIEVASHYAVPAGIAQLADLGARVIKVEPVTGDAYRHAVRGMGHDNLVRAVQGKENLAVNLKDPRGQEIVHRLVVRADAFIHNYRLGVPERLSIDEASLREINPRLVYQYGASYGSVGPYRKQPAIDHVIAAFAGTTAYQAGEGNPPLKEQGADPTAATGVAASMLLALLARDRTGEGQYVESAMIVSNLYLNAEDAFTYEGKVPRPSVDHRQFGLGATYRLYETAPVGADHQVESWENPDPRWVFLSAVPDDAFARLCAAIDADDLADDERFATQRLRHEHRDELGAALEPVFLTRSAPEWESMLRTAGVGCMVADGHSIFGFLHAHPQAHALGMTVTAEHPTLGGRYRRHAPAVRHADTPGVGGPYCETGEHTREILRELGYDEEEIADLHDAGVVTWPAQLAARRARVTLRGASATPTARRRAVCGTSRT